MSRIKLSEEQETWLADHHSNFSHKELAAKLGCCIDTLKRILMRRDLQYFPGAKYQFREKPKVWKRPCTICGCTKSRPKFQYRCNSCHEREEEHPDFFNETVYQVDLGKTRIANPELYREIKDPRWCTADTLFTTLGGWIKFSYFNNNHPIKGKKPHGKSSKK